MTLLCVRHLQYRMSLQAKPVSPEVIGNALTQINGNVEHRSARDSHQLVLGEGRRLKMQPAHRSLISRVRVVVLHEVDVDPKHGERFSVICLGKETAPVAVLPGAQQPDIREVQMFNLH